MVGSGRIARLVCSLCLLACAFTSLLAKEVQPGPKEAAPSAVVESWAMLFQMMDRLRSALSQRDLTLVHIEDPVASQAVSTLLAELANSTAPEAAAQQIAWTVFVREISGLHTAADAAQADACVLYFARVEEEFRALQAKADPAVLKAAQQYAERFTCPMHADVVGAKDDTQLVVLVPSEAATQHAVQATITTGAPLEAGKPAHAILHLRRADHEPVTLPELIETHTRKIHLLVVDGSLTDYHHEHPQPTGTPGDYSFDFTPGKPGPYLAWADLRPMPMGLQEYEKAIISGQEPRTPSRRKNRA